MADKLKVFADLARPLCGNWTDLAAATYTARIVMLGTPAIDQASNDIGVACATGAEAALITSAGHRADVYRFDRSVPGKGESQLGTFHSLEIPTSSARTRIECSTGFLSPQRTTNSEMSSKPTGQTSRNAETLTAPAFHNGRPGIPARNPI